MSVILKNDFYSIEDRNGVQYIVFSNMDFKKIIYHGNSRYFNLLTPGIISGESTATVDQIEIAKLFALPVLVFANAVVEYLKSERYNYDDTIFNIRDYATYNPEEDGDEDEFLNETAFRYSLTRHREILINSTLDKNEAAPEVIAQLRKELEDIQALNEARRIAFAELMRYCVQQIAKDLERLIDLFKADEALSFDEIHLVLSEMDSPLVISIEPGVNVIAKIRDVSKEYGFFGPYITFKFNVSHFNGTTFQEYSSVKRIYGYKNTMKPSEVGYFVPTDAIKKEVLDRSELYIKYAFTPHYAYHTGYIDEVSGWFTSSYPATGRCMIDVKTLSQVNPNFNDYFPYGAQPSRMKDSEDAHQKTSFDINNIGEEQRLNLSPYVYIFSFVAKKWARTLITNISDISFREDAFDKLVIDSDVKDLMFSLVDTSKHTITVGKDIIDNKGGGSIFLLAGNPGCGKTLTAETMAETLRRPLYMVGVGELGTDTKALEQSLTRVLNTASAWNAILLLDECDIFMEKRQNMDVYRNAMVGVFLRLLEYYPGILFLTTNRASNIDEAFYSRISLAIQYPDLDSQKRAIIWRNILALYKDAFDTSTIDINSLANIDINGRQIKNCVRLVLTYCSYKNKLPTTADFVEVLSRMQSFQNTHSK